MNQKQFDTSVITNLDLQNLDLSNETVVKNYFNNIKCVKDLFFSELDLNCEKLTILLNSMKHIKFYTLHLSYNIKQKEKDKSIAIVGDFIKHSKASLGTIILPDGYNIDNNAARILFPYFKQGKIKSISFSDSFDLEDDLISDYNSIAERRFHNNYCYLNTWTKQ